jgi:excisionase family DNA binding protein
MGSSEEMAARGRRRGGLSSADRIAVGIDDIRGHQRTQSPTEERRDTRTTVTGASKTPLTIEAAAERLGDTPRMVRRLVNERRIGFVRVGKFIRLRPDDVDAYLDQHFQPPIDHRSCR